MTKLIRANLWCRRVVSNVRERKHSIYALVPTTQMRAGCQRKGESFAAAAMLAQRPNDTRVSGAGPPLKAVVHRKAWAAPHPLQPIVRPRYPDQRRKAYSCSGRGDVTPSSFRTLAINARLASPHADDE